MRGAEQQHIVANSAEVTTVGIQRDFVDILTRNGAGTGQRRVQGGHKGEKMTPEEWIIKGSTGISSKTIWAALMGVVKTPTVCRLGDYDIPYDPSDFLRCHKLLQAVPGWRERLPEVAAVFPKWGPFVEAWPELERLYEKEQHQKTAPILYDKMKEVGKLACDAEDAFLNQGSGI